MERARRAAAERRVRTDQASRDYDGFLERIAVPLFHQFAAALKAEGYTFNVFAPGGSVRLMSDRAAEDFIELTLDATSLEPRVVGHSSRIRGRRVVESETPVADVPVGELTDEHVLQYLLKEIEPFVER
jgi:hypothetical protein